MKSNPAEIERVLARLEATPAFLNALAADHSPGELGFSRDKKTWSAQEVLAHLRACADPWIHSIYAMLAEAGPVLPDIDERKYARAARYAEVPYIEALRSFAAQRANLVRVLRGLRPEKWERSANILGRRHTVFSQARRMAMHEAGHCTIKTKSSVS